MLPVVFEADGESNTFELEVFWKSEEVEEDVDPTQGEESSQFVIEDEDDSGNDENAEPVESPMSNVSPQTKPKKVLPSLGERLFGCIIDLLFCCGFTLPTKIQVDHYKINYVIW